VDGVQISDPASETFYGCSRMASCIEVPYNNDTRFEPADVAHGETAMRRYYSKTSGAWRRIFVYLPPSYQKQADRKYPVLYILHGGGEDERGWALQGRTDIILENLIAQGKAEEFIVAMCDANCRDFEKEMLQECIPVVEQNYRVQADADHRAMAGLSMGGLYTLNTTINHPELFRYVGVFSSGWWANTPKGMENRMGAEQYYQKLAARPDYYNQQFREFFITMGGQEDIAFNNCRIMRERFDKIGIKYSYFEAPGGHTWPVWRESLYQFAQRLFKDKVQLANDDHAKDYYVKPVSATSSVDDQGFIRRWRLLEPLSRPVRTNAVFTDTYLREAFNTQYFKNQMTILPKDGQKVNTTVVQEVIPPGFGRGPQAQQPAQPTFKTVKETLTWHELESSRYNVKLFRFGEEYKQRLYGVLYWAVTVVDCPEDMENVRLAVGSNSASMWWVNGKEVLLMSGDRRMVVDDCVSQSFTLKKGQNIIRGSVINGPGMSDFCVRLINEKGEPIKNVTIR
jgi:enterochelin esterase-like enzyme